MLAKGHKFGISPQALKQQNAQLSGLKPKPKLPSAPDVTHVSGVPIPPVLKQHFTQNTIVPSDHPLREHAAKFVTDVWRKNPEEGRRMSERMLGIGPGGKKIVKLEPGATKPLESPHFPTKEQGEAVRQGLGISGEQKTGLANVAQEAKNLLSAVGLGKAEGDPPDPKPIATAPVPATYNPKTERPNQRARVQDVKARLTAAPMLGEGGHKVSLSTTNSKLAKDGVASFNLVPIETCPGAGSCAKYCYADTGSYLRFHGTTMPPRVSNWLASQKDDFVPKMVDMIAKAKAVKGKKAIKAIRVHDSGDFYSPQYIDKWHQIASAHPDMMFYAYTKSHHPKLRERLNELEKLPNFNIVQSFGSKYDQLIDPSKPHAVVFPSKELMDKAGYADAMETDLTAADKNNTKVGLYIHGQYDKSYPGLEEHIKDNPQVKKEIEESLKANGGQMEPAKKVS